MKLLRSKKGGDSSKSTNPGAKRHDDKLRQQGAGLNTFRRAAEYWYQFKSDSGRSSATLKKIRDYLDKDLLPALGEKQLELITRSGCAKLQACIEKRGAFNVADKTRTWLKQIFSPSHYAACANAIQPPNSMPLR